MQMHQPQFVDLTNPDDLLDDAWAHLAHIGLFDDIDSYVELKLIAELPGGRFRHYPKFLPVSHPRLLRAGISAYWGANWLNPSMLLLGINARARCSSRDEGVDAVRTVGLDLDGGRGLSIDEQFRRVDTVAAIAPPSMVVRSGTGCHAHVYWTFDSLVDPEIARAEVKHLRRWTQSDVSEPPSKNMRMPGSFNWKHGQRRRLQVLHRGPRVGLQQLQAAIRHVAGEPDPPRVRRGERVRTRRRRAVASAPRAPRPRDPAARSFQVPQPEPVEPARIERIWASVPAWTRGIIQTGDRQTRGYPSGSEMDAAVVRMLLEAGATDDEVLWFYLAHPEGIGRRLTQRGEDYLWRTVAAMQDAIEDSIPADQSVVEVTNVYITHPHNRGAYLSLLVVEGEHEGAELRQWVNVDGAYWPYLVRAMGLVGAAREQAVVREMVGKRAQVTLGRWSKGLQVRLWLHGDLGV